MDFTVWYRTDGTHGQDNGTLAVDGQHVTFTGKHGTTDMSHVLDALRGAFPDAPPSPPAGMQPVAAAASSPPPPAG